jgi:uncharacterized membrane protein YkvA (DUF1232 family)
MWFRQQAASPGGGGQSFSGPNFSKPKLTWQDFVGQARRFAADEGDLRRRIWNRLKREAANIPFVEDALTAHYCAFDRKTPLYVKLALVGAVVYFIVPDDLIPDSSPVLGYADDAAVMAAALKMFSSHIKPEHREAARLMLEQMRRA